MTYDREDGMEYSILPASWQIDEFHARSSLLCLRKRGPEEFPHWDQCGGTEICTSEAALQIHRMGRGREVVKQSVTSRISLAVGIWVVC